MSIVYPERWRRKATRNHRQAAALARAMAHLQQDLRAAGFEVAADLVAAGEAAVWHDLAEADRTP